MTSHITHPAPGSDPAVAARDADDKMATSGTDGNTPPSIDEGDAESTDDGSYTSETD